MEELIPLSNNEEKVFVYAYLAGHGCGDVFQYFFLNEEQPTKALFGVEECLRNISDIGGGNCFVFAVYDICRQRADWIK